MADRDCILEEEDYQVKEEGYDRDQAWEIANDI